MDGVLYLTDRRVLFEQKERTGAFLGLFGGRNQQALTWAVALTDIEDVRAEDRGIFGVKLPEPAPWRRARRNHHRSQAQCRQQGMGRLYPSGEGWRL